MKNLNLGCGYNYGTSMEWTNLDFTSTGQGVIAHNLLLGIPFKNESFDLVYHSHLLEHFTKEDGEKLIAECFRVLRPGGILRIAVPDLESIVKNYLNVLESGLNKPGDEMIRANYDWIMLELYDQTVRTKSGGNMAKYLFQDFIKNEAFVFERIGEEGRSIRNLFLNSKENKTSISEVNAGITKKRNIINALKKRLKKYLLKSLKVEEQIVDVGKFRLSGEVHQWMYDRFSLFNLLQKYNGRNIEVKDAFTSFNSHWAEYNIDGIEGVVRKPDSLFMEAIK